MFKHTFDLPVKSSHSGSTLNRMGYNIACQEGPQVEPSSARLWGPGDQPCCGITGGSFPGGWGIQAHYQNQH